MNLSELLKSRKIERYQSSQTEIDSKINIADANMRSCNKIVLMNDPGVPKDDNNFMDASD